MSESPQRTISNVTTANGERISMCRCPIDFPNTEICLSLSPGVLFTTSNYWAFSVLVCVDEQVVEERFIDWETETDPLNGYHPIHAERMSFDFEGLYSAPLQTLSIGFFVYYIDRLNGVKSLEVSSSEPSPVCFPLGVLDSPTTPLAPPRYSVPSLSSTQYFQSAWSIQISGEAIQDQLLLSTKRS